MPNGHRRIHGRNQRCASRRARGERCLCRCDVARRGREGRLGCLATARGKCALLHGWRRCHSNRTASLPQARAAPHEDSSLRPPWQGRRRPGIPYRARPCSRRRLRTAPRWWPSGAHAPRCPGCQTERGHPPRPGRGGPAHWHTPRNIRAAQPSARRAAILRHSDADCPRGRTHGHPRRSHHICVCRVGLRKARPVGRQRNCEGLGRKLPHNLNILDAHYLADVHRERHWPRRAVGLAGPVRGLIAVHGHTRACQQRCGTRGAPRPGCPAARRIARRQDGGAARRASPAPPPPQPRHPTRPRTRAPEPPARGQPRRARLASHRAQGWLLNLPAQPSLPPH